MTNEKQYNLHYLERIRDVIDNAVREHPRTLAVRIDLRLSPDWSDNEMITCFPNLSENVMARFIRSLKAKIAHYSSRLSQEGKRAHPCTLRYFWVKEINDAVFPHYHVVIFLNKDLFWKLGNATGDKQCLWTMILDAWLSALDLSGYNEYYRLVHFPPLGEYVLNYNSPEYSLQFDKLFSRLRYLAKERTKVYSPDKRSMGCSQK